ncbi:MAG TPA: MFS transporter [Candidatus Baltobacteraceae bacterium]|nr:MFS transporter [Candidatus Baltobacteraceae bacterium]
MRIIPVAVVTYVLAYVDRINVAMVLPYVDRSFGLTNADVGFAAGIFFVGYMLLQIPAGMLAYRWGARRVVAILMILWGLSAIATGLVETKNELFVARFVLGVFEGGVWPAVLVLLATWFAPAERARANALWMICLPISAVIMAPITGWLLGILPWRWVFIAEGVPPLMWVVVWLVLIADRPRAAKWLAPEERERLEERLAAGGPGKAMPRSFVTVWTDPRVLWLAAAYFFWMVGFYGYTMWVPSVVKGLAAGRNSSLVGWIVAVPFAFAIVAMVLNSVWSDRRLKRRAHVWGPLLVGVVGLAGGQWMARSPAQELGFLVLTAIGVYAPFGPFWAIPSALLPAEVLGAALGIINAIGNLGGFVGPYVVGYIRGQTHGSFAGLLALGASLLVTVVIVVRMDVDRRALPPEPRCGPQT